MQYLPSLTSAETEITIEQLDKVARTLNEKIKSFVKLFGVILSWIVFNIIVSLFFNRTRSISLGVYRMISEGLRNLSTQDIFFVITLLFDDKISCIISMAIVFVLEISFIIKILYNGQIGIIKADIDTHNKSVQHKPQSGAYVVSYKQQVAFLA